MGKIIGIGAIMLLLVGGGVGAMVFLGIGPFGQFNPFQNPGDAENPKEEVFVRPSYMDLEVFSVPVMIEDQKSRIVHIMIKLEVAKEKRLEIVHSMPVLRDAFLRDLLMFLPYHVADGRHVDAATVTGRFMRIADRLYGPGVVKNVLVKELLERR